MLVLSNETAAKYRLNYIILHCKKSWRKTPPAWPDVTDSLVRGTENFFDMKIKLIRRVPTMKREYFEISEIFLQWIWRVETMLTEYFEINEIFLRFFVLTWRSFPTIFRQLSDEWIKIKSSTIMTRTSFLQDYNLPLYHCATTLTEVLCTFNSIFLVSTLFILVSTVLTSVNIVLFFVSTVLTFVNTVLKFLNNLWGKEPSRNRVVVWPARQQRLAEFLPWNQFLGSLKVLKFGLCVYCNIHRSIYELCHIL